jgi:hypothetical protein
MPLGAIMALANICGFWTRAGDDCHGLGFCEIVSTDRQKSGDRSCGRRPAQRFSIDFFSTPSASRPLADYAQGAAEHLGL